VYAVGYWNSRPHPIPKTGSLGTLRTPALVVTALGISTCCVPLVFTHPAVLGRIDWSALNLVGLVVSGNLRLSPVVFDVAISYLLLLAAFVALCFARPRKVLLLLSLLGVICSSWAVQMAHHSLFDWFTHSDGRLALLKISYGPAMYALEISMALLLLIAARGEDLDLP
jgi:hypothetical protein